MSRERLRVRAVSNDEGNRLLRIVRRSSGSVVTWPRAQMVLLSVQGVDVGTGHRALVLPGIVVAYGAGWGWPGLFQFSIAHHYREATGRVTGRVMTGMMLGGVVGPVVFSVLHDRWGYAAAWTAVAGATMLGAAATVWAAYELRGGAPAVFRQLQPVAP